MKGKDGLKEKKRDKVQWYRSGNIHRDEHIKKRGARVMKAKVDQGVGK